MQERVWLTADEMTRIRGHLDGIDEDLRFAARRASPPPGARPVMLTYVFYPLPGSPEQSDEPQA